MTFQTEVAPYVYSRHVYSTSIRRMFVVYGMNKTPCVRELHNKKCAQYSPAVNSMSILCLWNTEITLDWDGIEP